MNATVRTHNAYHLGDNLVHLNFLRRAAKANPDRQFVHFAQWQYIMELRDLIHDIPNISLAEFGYTLPSDSIDAWRGSDNHWYNHPDRNDFVKYHVESWFPRLAHRMGVENPVTEREDMLFDYPAITNSNWRDGFQPSSTNFDVLVINSAPGSGQFHGYNQLLLGDLARAMAGKGHRVITTAPLYSALDTWRSEPDIYCTANHSLSVTQIGHLSLHCHTILMVSTGPSWPTFNIWNSGKDAILSSSSTKSAPYRIILIDSERINLAPNTRHTNNIAEAASWLKEAGLL